MAWASIDPTTSPPSIAIGAAKAEHNLCLQIPGCNQGKDGIWRTPLTWPTFSAFRAVWSVQPIEVLPPLAEWERTKWGEIQARMAGRIVMDAPEPLRTQLIMMDDGLGRELDGIQRAHVAWLATWRRCIIGDPMGNGKSPPLIRALQVVPDALPALIICPDSAPLEWQRKIAAWAPDLTCRVVSGTALRRRQALEPGADIYVIAWSNVRLHTRLASYPSQRFVTCDEHGGVQGKSVAACEVHEKELNTLGLRTIIPDECHRMKDPRGKMSRAVQWLGHHAENFWPVTGTLTASDVGDLWAVLHAIEPRGWPSRGRYMDLYAQQELAFFGGKAYAGLRPDTEPYFHVAVDPLFRRLPVRSGRPERAEPEFRHPKMTPAQQRAYTQLRKELLTELPAGHSLVPDNDAVKFGRLVQLASSMIEMGEGESALGFTQHEVKLCLPSNKADDLLEFLADNPGQWIVYAFSPALIELMAHKLDLAKIAHQRIVGGMGMEAKDAAQQLFQSSPQVRVMFLTNAGGESIDLQCARGVVFTQAPPSYIMREQVIGRADRRGQQFNVRTVYMISPGTVDQRLYDLGCEKEDRAAQVNRDAELMRWVAGGELAADAG